MVYWFPNIFSYHSRVKHLILFTPILYEAQTLYPVQRMGDNPDSEPITDVITLYEMVADVYTKSLQGINFRRFGKLVVIFSV